LLYELGIFGKDKSITAIQALSENEFQAYCEASAYLMDFSRNQQLYRMVLLNYEDFLKIVIKYSDDYKRDPSNVNLPIMEKIFVDINRYLLNFLSSVRTFLDHTETKLKTEYGNDSIQVSKFKNACSIEYDSNFSYRFLYKLRNYSQHCGLPIEGFSLKSKEEPEFSGNITNSLIIKFRRDGLLKFDGWGSKIKQEISALPEEFNVIHNVDKFYKSLDKINNFLIKENSSELIKRAEYIERLIMPAESKEGTPIIFTFINEGRIKRINIFNIPFHLIEYAKLLKNQEILEESEATKKSK
jgi:hypothetical protein